MALRVHCSYEPGWYPHLAFRDVDGDLVHWVEPYHFAANGQLLDVHVHGTQRVAALEDVLLSEPDVKGMTRLFRDEP